MRFEEAERVFCGLVMVEAHADELGVVVEAGCVEVDVVVVC